MGALTKGFGKMGKVITPNMRRQMEEEMSQMGPEGMAAFMNFGKGKGKDDFGKGKGKGRPEWDGTIGTEDDAIREIYQQLQKPPHNKVYFDNWRERFPDLGPSYKDYMLSRPDLVELTFEGNRYTVTWVGEEMDI